MQYELKGLTRLEIRIFDGFNGENIRNDYNHIKKILINQVLIDFDKDFSMNKITNFSTFLRSFFVEYEELNLLKVSTYDIGLHETFKDFFILSDNFKHEGVIYGKNLEHFDLEIVSQKNCPSDKGLKYYLENLFGTGFLKHVGKITMNTKNGIVCDSIYSDKKSFENLVKCQENIKNIYSIYSDFMYYYYGKEV